MVSWCILNQDFRSKNDYFVLKKMDVDVVFGRSTFFLVQNQINKFICLLSLQENQKDCQGIKCRLSPP
jgi:hypothetical protein